MRLSYITFTFENCDQITIDGKYVGDFLVDDIKTSIERVASNSINRIDTANVFSIEIHKGANKDRHPFNQTDLEGYKEKTFNKLIDYDDITGIDFELVDDYVKDDQKPRVEHYSYYVNWVGNSEYENEAQSTYVSQLGHLYLTIAKDKGLVDFYNVCRINDEQVMDFHFRMLNISDESSDPDEKNGE